MMIDAEMRSRILQKKRDAKKRGIRWTLSDNHAANLLSQPCHYCGVEERFMTIDRRVNNKHYHRRNCVPACEDCNCGKRWMTETEFYRWIERVYNHQHQRLTHE